MTYNHLQPRSSPLGMRAYKTFDPSSLTFGTDIFLKHNEIAVMTTPCFSGKRVCCYEHIIGLQKYICDMRRVFSWLFHFKEIGVNADHIAKFYEYSTSTKSKEFYSVAYNMQWCAVLDWNADANKVTMSFNMGFVGIREDLAAGAGSVVLDMLLKFGLLKYNDNESWELEPNYRVRRLYSFGDRKSNKKNVRPFSWYFVTVHWHSKSRVCRLRYFLSHFRISCSCLVTGTPEWICYNLFTKCSGLVYLVQWRVSWAGSAFWRMFVGATFKPLA